MSGKGSAKLMFGYCWMGEPGEEFYFCFIKFYDFYNKQLDISLVSVNIRDRNI